MLKSSLNLQLGQTLTMTPQLQQAIRLLQLSTLELQLEVQQALESNPMLELAEDANTSDGTPETETGPETEASAPDQPGDGESWDTTDYGSSTGQRSESDDRDPFENQAGAGGGLHEHLLWQLHLSPLNDADRRIGAALIDSINADGYLETDLDSLQDTLGGETEVGIDEIEAVLHWIQQCDPVGVGARNLRECLSIQLRSLPPATPERDAALRVVADGMDHLARHDFKGLQRALGLSEAELARSLELIRTLNPRPGSQISNQPPEYVTPDVYVRRDGTGWRVDLNPEIAPRIRINSLYAGMVRRVSDARDSAFMRNQLQEARWFLKSLHSRNETLLRVARAIVERQTGFLEQGEVAMQPLILRDIAEALGMHESTISRVTTQKYMHTPRGVFEFKYFFSSHVGTRDGGECSATAIRAMIRQLISEEPPDRPMSDSRLAQVLSDRGINVARRTVAKYREAMNLPPSSERRQLV
ncbi:RNA polymerase sigma-54 factor RpoN [Thioalkalivibrio nitratireducens DSM 14787]|uniref:RNA polymerase sigma-54 factor n=1 Tax=Thioalkalivibrio nitratireducens (strain DSM 14787 / UNIQEM 213 / ALEN2) TaxID=1255043 RepID=L0DZ10_THIND|nr:RNA polymerase factor sigma-54 [Thioalkalivibrio nitratireducens]AGA34283.1 RNA polymerase sigma-54 factor RpoN [Thioalkalivibrio nitratireducens DSM 14787]